MTSRIGSNFLPLALPALLTALALGWSGCESGPPRGGRGSTGDAPMTATGELANPNPKPMEAQGTFFAGQIQAEVLLGKSDVPWNNNPVSDNGPGNGPGGGGGRGGGGSGFSGGFGGGGGGGGRRGGGGGGGGRRGGGGDSDTPRTASADAPHGPAIRATNAPPVQLRLRLTNHGVEAATVEVLDFNSDLGNFVVQPEKIALPPGQPVEAEPMTSRLGVPAVEEIPLTVRLRVNGKTETQVLKLHPRPDEPAGVAPAPGAAAPE